MNATALRRRAHAHGAAAAGGRGAQVAQWHARAPLLAFAALALLAGMRFASLLAHPPLLRAIGVVAVAAALGETLARTRSLPRRRGLATIARLLTVAVGAYLALRATGVPVRLLSPWRWPRLARELGRGSSALDGLWPYAGGVAYARLDVLLALPATILPAAALAFWPGGLRVRERRMLALALLLALYVTAAANQPQIGWQVEGVLLLGLLCLWLWAWGPGRLPDARASAWILVLCAVALIGAGPLNPGRPLVDYRDWNPFGAAFPATSFEWNQVYGPLPWSKSTETMVSVSSPGTHLWRATTLDQFDGVRFRRSGRVPASAGEGTGGARGARWITRATFTVRGLHSAQLLSPGAVISASIVGADTPRLAAIAADGTIGVAGAAPQSGDRYTVTAYAPAPSAAEMREAPPVVPAVYAPYTEFDLPSAGARAPRRVSAASPSGVALIEASPYGRVYALARRLAAGERSTYGVVSQIESFLRRGFIYNEDPPRSAYPLVSFLLSERAGYCQQFSGAMTLLLRMDGVPARVAAGFLATARDRSSGVEEVGASDAHAWVEVYFAGIGWVPFDPTPAAPRSGSAEARRAAQAAEKQVAARKFRNRGAQARRRAEEHAGVRAGVAGAPLGSGVGVIAAAVAAALALLLAGVCWAGTLRIERTLGGHADGAVRELARGLSRVGRTVAPGTTLAELERQLERSYGPAAGRYVALLRLRRYSPSADPRRPSAHDRRLLRRALCAGRGPLAYIRALLALPPGLPRAPHRR